MTASATPQTRRRGKRLRAPGGSSDTRKMASSGGVGRTWARGRPKPDHWAGNVGLYRKLRLASSIRHEPPIDAAAQEKSGDSGSTAESKRLTPIQIGGYGYSSRLVF